MKQNPMIAEFRRELAAKQNAAKVAWATFAAARSAAVERGAQALNDKSTLATLEKAGKAYDDARDAVAVAESTMARMAVVMSDPAYAPSDGGVDVSACVRGIAEWAQALGAQTRGDGPLPTSPGFPLIARDDVAGALMTTTSYPTVPHRRPGIVPLPASPLTILDVLPVIPTDNDVVEYVAEQTFTNTAAETAEGSAAPAGTLVYEKKTATCKWIPFTIPSTKQVLADEGRLASFIETRLVRGVRERLQTQVISGSGAGENLTGITNTSGILIQDAGADTRADLVHKAKTKAIVATKGLWAPQTLLIHPNDFERLVLEKEGTAGAYVFGSPGSRTPWGLTPVVNVDIAEGSPIVCDITAAELYVREDVSVAVSDSHEAQFTAGIVQFMASGRFVLVVLEPKAFVVITDFDS